MKNLNYKVVSIFALAAVIINLFVVEAMRPLTMSKYTDDSSFIYTLATADPSEPSSYTDVTAYLSSISGTKYTYTNTSTGTVPAGSKMYVTVLGKNYYFKNAADLATGDMIIVDKSTGTVSQMKANAGEIVFTDGTYTAGSGGLSSSSVYYYTASDGTVHYFSLAQNMTSGQTLTLNADGSITQNGSGADIGNAVSLTEHAAVVSSSAPFEFTVSTGGLNSGTMYYYQSGSKYYKFTPSEDVPAGADIIITSDGTVTITYQTTKTVYQDVNIYKQITSSSDFTAGSLYLIGGKISNTNYLLKYSGTTHSSTSGNTLRTTTSNQFYTNSSGTSALASGIKYYASSVTSACKWYAEDDGDIYMDASTSADSSKRLGTVFDVWGGAKNLVIHESDSNFPEGDQWNFDGTHFYNNNLNWGNSPKYLQAGTSDFSLTRTASTIYLFKETTVYQKKTSQVTVTAGLSYSGVSDSGSTTISTYTVSAPTGLFTRFPYTQTTLS